MIFQIKEKRVILIDRTMRLVGDNEYEFEFEFDEEWEGKTKTARFVMGDYMKDIVLNNDRCVIDKTFFKGGQLKVGVYASNLATEVLERKVKSSILEEDGGEPTVPENLWTQLLEIIDADVHSVRNAVSDAEQHAQNAQQYAQNAQEYAQNTQEYAQNAQEAVSGFGDVVQLKTAEFNTNAEAKQTEFNQNAANKIAEYDEHTSEYAAEIDLLKDDLDGLKPTKLFIDRNDFIGNPLLLENVLQLPYELNDFVIKSIILSSGAIGTSDTRYKGFMVSPLIPIVGGKTYAIKANNIFAKAVNDGYGLFGEDGTSVVSKTSLSNLGDNIFLIRTTVGASYIRFTLTHDTGTNDAEDNNYRLGCVSNFNKWWMIADADESITADDFIEHPVENSTISKIKRADGSKLEIVDDYLRQKVDSIGDVSKLTIRTTGVDGTPNILNGNYETTDFVINSIILSSGNIGTNASTYKNYCVSPIIEISGGKTYAIKTTSGVGSTVVGQLASVNDGYGLFGEDGTTVVSKISFAKLGDNIILIKTPTTAKYIRFTIYSNSYTSEAVIEFNKWWMIETDKDNVTADDFIKPTKQYILGGIVMDADTVPMDSMTESNAILPLYGKTIVNFGDSIFGNIRPPYDISTLIAKYTGANVINCAFGGCRMASHTGHWDAFSMYRLADSVASNDWSVQDEAIQYDDRTSYAEEPLANLKAIDWNNVDIITIGYCTNDWGGNKLLDNSDNHYDTTTLGGAFRYSLEKILTAYPHIRIVTLGAIYRTKLDSSSKFVEDSDTWLNDKGLLLSQYNDKLKEICEQYHIEYLDNMNIGFNKFTRLKFYPSYDGTHPNVKGLEVYAKHIARHL